MRWFIYTSIKEEWPAYLQVNEQTEIVFLYKEQQLLPHSFVARMTLMSVSSNCEIIFPSRVDDCNDNCVAYWPCVAYISRWVSVWSTHVHIYKLTHTLPLNHKSYYFCGYRLECNITWQYIKMVYVAHKCSIGNAVNLGFRQFPKYIEDLSIMKPISYFALHWL